MSFLHKEIFFHKKSRGKGGQNVKVITFIAMKVMHKLFQYKNYLFTTFNYLYCSNTHLLTFDKYLSRGYYYTTEPNPGPALRIYE